MYIAGIDLSGPGNVKDTVLTVFKAKDDELYLHRTIEGAGDAAILDCITGFVNESEVVTGIDAPLSYNISGGDRPSDSFLRKIITEVGLHHGSIMVPTMTRMVYLTLRGISLARLLQSIQTGFPLSLVEVHPGAAMALRDAPIEVVRGFKHDLQARIVLLKWLDQQGLRNIDTNKNPSDHYVAACAAALAAWKWRSKEPKWLHEAKPPFHPFDFAC